MRILFLGVALLIAACQSTNTDDGGSPFTLDERAVTLHDSILALPPALIADAKSIERTVRDNRHPNDEITFKGDRGVLDVQHLAGRNGTFTARSTRAFLDPDYFKRMARSVMGFVPGGSNISSVGTPRSERLAQYQTFRRSGLNCLFALTGSGTNLRVAASAHSETQVNTLMILYYCSKSEEDRDAALEFALNFDLVSDREAYRQDVSRILGETS